ncbi:thioesterase family protein [Ketobacter sp.]|uniref:thioesterase family protein n=1 Tax=Ketobacter sp. TaxID=2083498 RepID=UPI000F18E891|nr:thioesterase family protein [Ketobacter sp.]RLU00353.1 MAG: thioesterase family protein [Ketobacter sp.]
MQFTDLLTSIQSEPGVSLLPDPADWLQGRALFGGLQTILCLHAMRSLLPEVPLRSLQTTFIQPARSPQVRAVASVIRAGKNVTHAEARLLDDEENVVALVVGVFGAARESAVNITPQQPAVDSERPRHFKQLPGVPGFTKHFSATWLVGKLPFGGDDSTHNVVQLGMPGEQACSEYHVVALADFIPPVALSHLRQPVPGSSMTWMLEFLGEDFNGLPLENWRVDADLVAAGEGYTHQSVTLWGPNGKPIALSRQNMVVFG